MKKENICTERFSWIWPDWKIHLEVNLQEFKGSEINIYIYEDLVFIENKFIENIERKDIEDMIEAGELKKVLFGEYETAVKELIHCWFIVVNIFHVWWLNWLYILNV